ncbi:MAG: PAS domain-containing sensor histidine kinase [Bdellovibrionia bacterium]
MQPNLETVQQYDLGQFRVLTDAFPQIACILDENRKLSCFNRRWFDYTGYDVLNWNPSLDPYAAVHPDDLKKVVVLWEQAGKGFKAFEIEIRLKKHGGSYRWHMGKLVPIKDKSGVILGYWGTATDIEDQVAARVKLAEVENLFRSLVDLIPLAAWIIDQETNEIYFNHQWYEDLGYSRVQVILDWWIIIHPDDQNGVRKIQDQFLSTGELTQFECRFRTASGDYRWYLVKVVSFKDGSGKVFKRLGTATNIHEQKTKEENLKRLLMEAPSQIMIFRGPEHYIDFINVAALKNLVEYPNVIGKSFYEAFSSDPNFSQSLKTMDLVYTTGKAFSASEYPLTKDWNKNGSATTRHFNTVVQPTHDDNGKINGLISFILDVTQEIEAKKAIENQQKWLQAALDAVPIALTFLEPGSGNIIFTNEAGNKLAGVKNPVSKSGREYYQIFKPRDDEGNLLVSGNSLSAKIVRGEVVRDETIILQTPAGKFNVVVAAETLPAMYGHPDTIVLAFQDITRLKQVETELHKLVKAREELMSICGHEFKTPLSSLSLQFQIVQKRIKKGDTSVYEPEVVQERMRRFNSQIERLVRLVDDMLDITTLTSGKLHLNLEKMDLSLLVFEVLGQLSNQLKDAGCSVTTSAAPGIIGTWDKFRLEQVLINLITNAMRYGKSKPISIVVEQKEGSAFLSVQDQGIGIAKEDQQRIFERFERAICANEVSGLGLGLYIVRGIVQAHQGKVKVESALGEGSRFAIEIPLSGAVDE